MFLNDSVRRHVTVWMCMLSCLCLQEPGVVYPGECTVHHHVTGLSTPAGRWIVPTRQAVSQERAGSRAGQFLCQIHPTGSFGSCYIKYIPQDLLDYVKYTLQDPLDHVIKYTPHDPLDHGVNYTPHDPLDHVVKYTPHDHLDHVVKYTPHDPLDHVVKYTPHDPLDHVGKYTPHDPLDHVIKYTLG